MADVQHGTETDSTEIHVTKPFDTSDANDDEGKIITPSNVIGGASSFQFLSAEHVLQKRELMTVRVTAGGAGQTQYIPMPFIGKLITAHLTVDDATDGTLNDTITIKLRGITVGTLAIANSTSAGDVISVDFTALADQDDVQISPLEFLEVTSDGREVKAAGSEYTLLIRYQKHANPEIP